MTPDPIHTLVGRYDPNVYDERRRPSRIRIAATGEESLDVVIEDGAARIVAPSGRADAELTASPETWREVAQDAGAAMAAYRRRRLVVRHDLHAGIGFLAATSGASGPGRLCFHTVSAGPMRLSLMEAGTGPAVIAVHGLGATKGSFLTTVLGLADRFRVIALDLPGFGDSDKPIGAAYDAPFFARAGIDLLDALDLERAHVIGNSLGGRIALEIGLRAPDRVERLALLAPSLAWRRERHWVPFMRLFGPSSGSCRSRRGVSSRASCAPSSPGPTTAGRRPAWTSSSAPISPPRGGPPSTPPRGTSTSRSPTARPGSGPAWPGSSRPPCSSGAGATGSCRSPSSAT